MGFNKKYLGSLKDAETLYESLGKDEFARLFKKADVIIGNSEAIDFVWARLEEYDSKK